MGTVTFMSELVILGSGGAFATATRSNPSVALLHRSSTYLFDCGEPVAASLYRHGISVTSVRSIFVSHLHMDHLGGLPQLINAIRLMSRNVDPSRGAGLPWSMHVKSPWHLRNLRFPMLADGITVDTTLPTEIRLHLPASAITPFQEFLAACMLGPERLRFKLAWPPIRLGEIHAEPGLKVTATRATQLPQECFSFLIELEGRRIIYSGDLGGLDDLRPIIAGTELLLLETSHLRPAAVASFLRETQPQQTVLVHVHPGMEDRAVALVREVAELNVSVAYDGLRIAL